MPHPARPTPARSVTSWNFRPPRLRYKALRAASGRFAVSTVRESTK
jgi:hypothetical protein